MRINSALDTQHATFDGSGGGEGLAIFFSQEGGAIARYRFQVSAITNDGTLQVGTFYSSPPNATIINGNLTRLLAIAVCPGAISWAVDIRRMVIGEGALSKETAEVTLASSKCCTGPAGVRRVDERFAYHAGAGAGTVTLLAGQTVTGISAVGTGPGGTVIIGGGDTITVTTGIGMSLEPKGLISPGVPAIAFTNVDWVIEYLESA